MTLKGCDYAFTAPPVSALTGAGIGFAMRYLSGDPSKNLTGAERDALHTARIGIGLVWETTGRSPLAGYDQGLNEAHAARAQAAALGFPATLPIYFAIDLQADPEQTASAVDYLHGAADAEGSQHLVGAYGDYAVIEAAAAAGFTWLWQTYAWSNGQWAPGWTVRQVLNGARIGAVTVDLDEAAGTAGLWMPPGSVAPPAPAEASTRPMVHAGTSGYWVEVAQRSVMLAGCDPKGVDAHFGPHTEAAVRAAQSAFHIKVDGVVGPVTWGRLEARTLQVQKALAAARLGAGGTDAVAGPATAQEVLAFQRTHRLRQDGIVGPHTSVALHIPTTVR